MASAKSERRLRNPGSGAGVNHTPAEGWQNLTIPEENMTTEVDPIFAAIAAHKSAVLHYEAVLEADADHTDKALDRQRDALDDMLDTEPTTVAGALAKLHHLGEDVYNGGSGLTVYTYSLALYVTGVSKGKRVEHIPPPPF